MARRIVCLKFLRKRRSQWQNWFVFFFLSMIIRKSLVFILINICLLGKNWWYYKSLLDLNLKDQFYWTVVQWQVHHMKFKSIEKYISGLQ